MSYFYIYLFIIFFITQLNNSCFKLQDYLPYEKLWLLQSEKTMTF